MDSDPTTTNGFPLAFFRLEIFGTSGADLGHATSVLGVAPPAKWRQRMVARLAGPGQRYQDAILVSLACVVALLLCRG